VAVGVRVAGAIAVVHTLPARRFVLSQVTKVLAKPLNYLAISRFTEPISGLFDIDGTAKGNVTAPTLQAQIRGADVRFRNLERVELVSTTYNMTTRRVNLSRLDLRSPFGSVSGDDRRVAEAQTAPRRERLTPTDLSVVCQSGV
jgi:hypothetical protein